HEGAQRAGVRHRRRIRADVLAANVAPSERGRVRRVTNAALCTTAASHSNSCLGRRTCRGRSRANRSAQSDRRRARLHFGRACEDGVPLLGDRVWPGGRANELGAAAVYWRSASAIYLVSTAGIELLREHAGNDRKTLHVIAALMPWLWWRTA